MKKSKWFFSVTDTDSANEAIKIAYQTAFAVAAKKNLRYSPVATWNIFLIMTARWVLWLLVVMTECWHQEIP